MKIVVCIGSSCHLKGSRQVVEELQRLVKEHHVEDKVELSGTFCMGKCQEGVCVTVDGKYADRSVLRTAGSGKGICHGTTELADSDQ